MKKLLIFAIIFSSCVRYEHIAQVHDGDTVTTQTGERIRLAQIDAPELLQPYGDSAQIFLSNLVLNKQVRLVTHGKDKYGRTVADIYINGVYVNEAEIQAGLCWVYARYSRRKYYVEEREARAKAIGLWSQPDPLPPYKFRQENN